MQVYDFALRFCILGLKSRLVHPVGWWAYHPRRHASNSCTRIPEMPAVFRQYLADRQGSLLRHRRVPVLWNCWTSRNRNERCRSPLRSFNDHRFLDPGQGHAVWTVFWMKMWKAVLRSPARSKTKCSVRKVDHWQIRRRIKPSLFQKKSLILKVLSPRINQGRFPEWNRRCPTLLNSSPSWRTHKRLRIRMKTTKKLCRCVLRSRVDIPAQNSLRQVLASTLEIKSIR